MDLYRVTNDAALLQMSASPFAMHPLSTLGTWPGSCNTGLSALLATFLMMTLDWPLHLVLCLMVMK